MGIDLRRVVADLCSSERPGRQWQPWWVLGLVEELAHDDTSRTFRSMSAAGEEYGWGWVEHLLASIFDAMQVNTVVSARVAGAKKVRPPKPFPRPGEKRAETQGARTMTQILSQRKAVEKQKKRPERVTQSKVQFGPSRAALQARLEERARERDGTQ